MPELKIYKVKDLREWLTNNHPAKGLSERVIAPTRAWAIMHNPYVKDEDAIVAAIFEDGDLAAYTASFPDMLDGKRVWWASTLYCYPKFTGKGYGLIVVGSLMEAHEPELTYDRRGAQETVEIFQHFGYNTIYKKRYELFDKSIDLHTLRGKIAGKIQTINKERCASRLAKYDYTLRYATYIDGEAYAFMQAHMGNDLWLREQEMLNWMLRYPFKQGCSMYTKVVGTNEFSSDLSSYEYKVVKVYVDSKLQGVYVLRNSEDELNLMYIYCEVNHRDAVFASIIDHVFTLHAKAFIAEDKDVIAYIDGIQYFPKKREELVSLSMPVISKRMENSTLQLGDGDNFA